MRVVFMANYLEGVDTTRDDSPLRIGDTKIKDDKSNFDNLSNKGSVSNDFSGLQRVEFTGGSQGPGSKPEALHTEYAQGDSNEMAYTTEDIVFYLRKAGS